MVDYSHRPLTPRERDVTLYCDLVDSIVLSGYGAILLEYADELSCRQRVEAYRNDPEVAAMWLRVEEADEKLKAVLIQPSGASTEIIHRLFWYWGCTKNSPELERELREDGAFAEWATPT